MSNKISPGYLVITSCVGILAFMVYNSKSNKEETKQENSVGGKSKKHNQKKKTTIKNYKK